MPKITPTSPEIGTETVPKIEQVTSNTAQPTSPAPEVPVKKGRGKKKDVEKDKPKEETPLPPPPPPSKIEEEPEEPEQAPSGSLKAFILLDQKTGDPLAKYTNKQPRQAALKAAAEGHVDIIMREVGAAKGDRAAVLHRFTGERKQVPWADYGLPYNTYALKKVEELSGKPVPPELNVKGGAQALRDAGFKDFMFWKPNVKKVARINVPKVQGKAIIETVQEFVKGGLGA